MYLNYETLSNQSTPALNLIELTKEQEQIYLNYNGFVTIKKDDNNENNFIIEPDIEKWEKWKKQQPDLLEVIKKEKIEYLSNACNTKINEGTQVQLLDGSTESFTYDLADQSNVSEMFNAVLLGVTEYPYHANDNNCRMYSAQDIIAIYVTLSSYKTAQTTYHNQLKQYVKTLKTIDEVNAVVYGQELTSTYLDKYNELMTQAKAQLNNIVAKVRDNEAD